MTFVVQPVVDYVLSANSYFNNKTLLVTWALPRTAIELTTKDLH